MARSHGVPEQVQEFFGRSALRGGGVVAAVSGGADSVALLRACCETGVEPLVVAHVHHGLRGAAADEDARFVEDLAASLRLPFRQARLNPAVFLGRGNRSAAARAARYCALRDIAAREQIRFVATAHTADDQAETVLHRLIRGTGLYGLAGIPRTRPLGKDSILIRPLLTVTRGEIEEYLRALGQSWRDDATNRDQSFTRNRLRFSLMPLLRNEYNPRVREALTRLASQAARWRRREAHRLRRRLARIERPRSGGAVVLDRAALCQLRPESLADVLTAIWRRERWPRADMGQREFRRLAQWCLNPSAAIELPGGARARRHDRTIALIPSTLPSDME